MAENQNWVRSHNPIWVSLYFNKENQPGSHDAQLSTW